MLHLIEYFRVCIYSLQQLVHLYEPLADGSAHLVGLSNKFGLARSVRLTAVAVTCKFTDGPSGSSMWVLGYPNTVSEITIQVARGFELLNLGHHGRLQLGMVRIIAQMEHLLPFPDGQLG